MAREAAGKGTANDAAVQTGPAVTDPMSAAESHARDAAAELEAAQARIDIVEQQREAVEADLAEKQRAADEADEEFRAAREAGEDK